MQSPYLQPKVQFAFYAVAWLLFMVAALVPAGRGAAWVSRINAVALGLAFAIAPSMYIFFKAGFHQGSFFH